MTTRRNFLKGAAASGIAFCSCGMLDAARAQPKAPRLPIKINGKRVQTVDVHAHCYFREAINLMGDAADKVLPPVKGVPVLANGLARAMSRTTIVARNFSAASGLV